MTQNSPNFCLEESIRLAKGLECQTRTIADKKKSTLAGFGFLVRNRRLAEAILKLGVDHAYEGRMLLRSMIEIQTNYSWILLNKKEQRANRFLKFSTLEHISILNELSRFLVLNNTNKS